ncbi:MAG: calcium-binding protein, partial [Pseudomonadota bacterium]
AAGDTITDFEVGVDTIELSATVFSTLTPGALSASEFTAGPATTPDHHIIYDATTGALSYDADGTGLAPSIQFATLQSGLALSQIDFTIV